MLRILHAGHNASHHLLLAAANVEHHRDVARRGFTFTLNGQPVGFIPDEQLYREKWTEGAVRALVASSTPDPTWYAYRDEDSHPPCRGTIIAT